MIGCIPYTFGNQRLEAFCKHGTDLAKLAEFAQAVQQEYTVANVPFCELRDRYNLSAESPDVEGYGLLQKVIITFTVNGERFGFPIYAPRSNILTPVKRGKHTFNRVTQEAGERFADIYPADDGDDVQFAEGWLCR